MSYLICGFEYLTMSRIFTKNFLNFYNFSTLLVEIMKRTCRRKLELAEVVGDRIAGGVAQRWSIAGAVLQSPAGCFRECTET